MTLHGIAQDFRYACRTLAKAPAFTILAVAALALGIGSTTAIYTVVDSVLLKPLHFPEPDRLMMLWEVQPNSDRTNVVQTQNFLDWRERNRSFEAISAMLQFPVNLTGIGDPVQVLGLQVTADFFPILGVPPLLGRTIAPEEDVRGAPRTVVLSHSLFVQRYGADPKVVGQTISVNGSAAQVVGVMPEGFGFPGIAAELYLPLQPPKSAPNDGRNYRVLGRLKAGSSFDSARVEMKELARQTAQERPRNNTNWSATAIPLLEQSVGKARTAIVVLFGAVMFLLLIACANVANLLLMRAASRGREMTVRLALGARRWDLLRQLTAESLLMCTVAGILGVALAYAGVRATITSLPASFPLPRADEIQIDGRVLFFATAVSLGIGWIFGLLPAIQIRRENLNDTLRSSGRSVAAGQRRIRTVLVGVEVAVALLLVTGAGLMIRSFGRLSGVAPGFRSEGVLTMRMLLLPSKYSQAARRAAVVGEFLERIRALPQVSAAGSIHILPVRSGGNSGTGYYRSDRPAPPPGSLQGGDVSVVSSEYFRALGIPFLSGRDFDSRDGIDAPFAAILNESAAQMLFPGEDPIGKHVQVAWERTPNVEIVGVVGDIRHGGLQFKPDPCLFLPQSQEPNYQVALVVRSSGDPLKLAKSVQEQIRVVDPDQGVTDIRTMDGVVSDSIASPRLQAILLGLFGFIALALSALGIYGTISYSVVQRTVEIGIRAAIGATPAGLVGMIIREGLALTAGGSICGFAAAYVLTQYLRSLLYDVSPTDPAVFAAVLVTVFAVAILACVVPSWRTSRIDPATVLRGE